MIWVLLVWFILPPVLLVVGLWLLWRGLCALGRRLDKALDEDEEEDVSKTPRQ